MNTVQQTDCTNKDFNINKLPRDSILCLQIFDFNFKKFIDVLPPKKQALGGVGKSKIGQKTAVIYRIKIVKTQIFINFQNWATFLLKTENFILKNVKILFPL